MSLDETQVDKETCFFYFSIFLYLLFDYHQLIPYLTFSKEKN